jgi:hypothetical protein
MKRIFLLAALVAASFAFAGEGDADIVPYGYVSQVMRAASAPAKTRAQVVAETREAARLGLLQHREEGPIASTAEQESLIRRAGLRAIAIDVAR